MFCLFVFISFVHLCFGQSCGDGSIHYGESCYMYVTGPFTWFDAKVTCDMLRGKLVEIDSAAENNFIRKLVADHHDGGAWIGLEDIVIEGEFKWASTLKLPEYVQWKAGEPNDVNGEDCVVLENNGFWVDVDCEDNRYPFVCEMESAAHIIG